MIKFKYFKDGHKKSGYKVLETTGLSGNKKKKQMNEKFHGPTDHEQIYNVPPAFAGSYPDHDPNDSKGYPTKIDNTHKDHIHAYTRDSYQLNNYLHSKHEDPIWTQPHKFHDKQIDHLDDILSQHEAPQDMHVYTGLKANPLRKNEEHGISKQEDAGDHIKGYLPSYTSTSLHPDIARRFTSVMPDEDGYTHMLKIEIPKGSKHGMYVGHLSASPHEQEFLMQRGKRIHIHPEPEVHDLTDDDKISGFKKPLKIWHTRIVD